MAGGGLDNELKKLGKFVSNNKLGVATTALNYKYGGPIGKLFAAKGAADLIGSYQRDRAHSVHGAYGEGSSSYHYQQQPSYGSTSSASYNNIPSNTYDYPPQQPYNYPPQPQYGDGYNQQLHYGGGGNDGVDKLTRNLKQFGSTAMESASSAFKMAKSHVSGHHMDTLQPGRVVQLVSATTGTAVQIMSRPDGLLFVDAGAPANNDAAWNSHWTVTRLDEKVVQLVNNGSFLSIEPSGVCVRREQPPSQSCALRVHKCHQGVSFEGLRGCVMSIVAGTQPPQLTITPDARSYSASFTVVVIR